MRLEIDGDHDAVEFIDAGDLWGKGTYETQEILGKKKYHAVIGPAGENQVLYAGIVSNERIAGRTGVGAVMGSKQPQGRQRARARASSRWTIRTKFKEYTKEVRKLFKEHPVLGESMKRFGTGGIVNTTNGRNILPTRNFKHGHFDDAMKISGEYMEDHELVGREVELHPLSGDLRPRRRGRGQGPGQGPRVRDAGADGHRTSRSAT